MSREGQRPELLQGRKRSEGNSTEERPGARGTCRGKEGVSERGLLFRERRHLEVRGAAHIGGDRPRKIALGALWGRRSSINRESNQFLKRRKSKGEGQKAHRGGLRCMPSAMMRMGTNVAEKALRKETMNGGRESTRRASTGRLRKKKISDHNKRSIRSNRRESLKSGLAGHRKKSSSQDEHAKPA